MVTPADEQPETMTVDEFLAGARARLDRVQPQDLAREMADGALVIDTRDSADREAEGALPGSVIVSRNVLEWRMSPSSPTCLEGITADSLVIIVCNDGFRRRWLPPVFTISGCLEQPTSSAGTGRGEPPPPDSVVEFADRRRRSNRMVFELPATAAPQTHGQFELRSP